MTESATREDLVQNTLSEAWDLFSSDFVLWIVASLLMIGVSFLSLGLLSGTMAVGFIQLIEQRRAGEPASPTDVFAGFSNFGASLIASILVGVGVLFGFFLLVIPGVLFGLSMAFTFHAIAIDGDDATSAMSKSFNLVKENIAVSAVFLIIALVLTGLGSGTFFGVFLTMPFTMLMMTLAYHGLNQRSA